jgi:outer membrane biosynthesis protein TonB
MRPEPEPPRYAPRPDPRDDQRREARYDARPEPRPDPRYDPRPDSRYDPRPEPRPDPRLEPRYEARPEPRPEPHYEPRQEARYEEPVEPRYEPRPRPRPESREDYEFESGPLAASARSATNRPRRRAPAPQQVRTEPREGGGMPWRPIIIVALLAAGGVAFFQALPKQAAQTEANAPGQDLAEASRAAPLDDLTAPGGTSASGAAPIAPTVQPQRMQAARTAPQAGQAYQQPAVASAPAPQPAQNPIISFLPPQLQPAPTPTPTPDPVPAPVATTPAPQPAPAAVQPAPQPAPAQATATVSATPGPAPSGHVKPTWLRRPGAAQLTSAYPRRAADAGVGGQAQLDCLIQGDGALACQALSSSPSNYGFAEAGLAVARYFRAAPTLADGSSAYGKRTTLTIKFAAPN